MSDKSESCPSIQSGLRRVTELLGTDPGTAVDTVMPREFVRIQPDEKVKDAAQAFERYGLATVFLI